MILASTELNNLWTVDSVSVILAGPAKAVILSAWVEENARSRVFAIVIPFKGGVVTCAKSLVVLGWEKTAQVTVTVTALHMYAHATLAGLDQDVMSPTVLARRIATTVATVTLLWILLYVKTAVKAGWDQHVQTRVSLVNRCLWTADNASVGLGTQVREKI